MSYHIFFAATSSATKSVGGKGSKEESNKSVGSSFQIKKLARQVVVKAKKGYFVAELIGFETKSGRRNLLVQIKREDGSQEKLSISPRTEVQFFEALKIECSSCLQVIGCQYFDSEKISYCKACPRLKIHRACDLRDGRIEAMNHSDPETCDRCKKGWDDFGRGSRW